MKSTESKDKFDYTRKSTKLRENAQPNYLYCLVRKRILSNFLHDQRTKKKRDCIFPTSINAPPKEGRGREGKISKLTRQPVDRKSKTLKFRRRVYVWRVSFFPPVVCAVWISFGGLMKFRERLLPTTDRAAFNADAENVQGYYTLYA